MFATSVVLTVATLSLGQVRITEFMSEGQGDTLQGNGGRRQREFFEITNLGPVTADVSTWSYNDDNVNDPHNFGPSIGSIAPGESIVFTQMTADAFRTLWNLPTSTRIYSYLQLSSLGNADTINIYSSFTQNASTLVDSLSYVADARGSGISRNRPGLDGSNQFANPLWIPSSVGDGFGSALAPNAPAGSSFGPDFASFSYADLGNPGVYIPAPGAAALLVLPALGAFRRRR
ncbi:MAG: lamin tail domain-containing protein [Phycisphaerales bacterium]|nr:lamin tail domain-containing protein [Phycisphaerales bacterium]